MTNTASQDTAAAAAAGATGTPALGPELSKAEARQASNLRVTTKAIDALHARVARAKQALDQQQQQQQQQGTAPPAASSPTRPRAGAGVAGARSPTKSRTAATPTKSPSGKGKGSASKSPPGRRSPAAKGAGSKPGAGAEAGPDGMDLEGEEEEQEGGGGGGGGVRGTLEELASDVAGLKTLEAVGSENKNFHATISKLAKAAEKVWRKKIKKYK